MSHLLDMAVFPGNQGGPLEHIVAAKAIAFGEALKPEFKATCNRLKRMPIPWLKPLLVEIII